MRPGVSSFLAGSNVYQRDEFEGAQGAKFDQMKRRMEEQVQVERRK